MSLARPFLPKFLAAVAFYSFNALTSIALPTLAAEDIYRRVEQDGTLSFTNVPTDRSFSKVRLNASRRSRLPLSELQGTIAHHSRRHHLDPALLSAVIKAESDFNPDAVSKAGAIGLMQLMPETAARLNIRNPFDPEQNIAGGARYLRYLLDRFHGNLPLALAAYNAGATRVEQANTLPPIRETRHYVQKVLRFYRMFGEYGFGQSPPLKPFAHPTWPRTIAFSTVPLP